MPTSEVGYISEYKIGILPDLWKMDALFQYYNEESSKPSSIVSYTY